MTYSGSTVRLTVWLPTRPAGATLPCAPGGLTLYDDTRRYLMGGTKHSSKTGRFIPGKVDGGGIGPSSRGTGKTKAGYGKGKDYSHADAIREHANRSKGGDDYRAWKKANGIK